MAERRKIMRVPNGVAKQIAKAQGCGLTTVYSALRNITHSAQADKIRDLALNEYGGVHDKKIYF